MDDINRRLAVTVISVAGLYWHHRLSEPLATCALSQHDTQPVRAELKIQIESDGFESDGAKRTFQ